MKIVQLTKCFLDCILSVLFSFMLNFISNEKIIKLVPQFSLIIRDFKLPFPPIQ